MVTKAMGPLADRVKTTMWVAPELQRQVKRMSEALGVSQTAIMSLAAAQYAVQLSLYLGPGVKRKDVLKKMQSVFNGIVDRAAEGL